MTAKLTISDELNLPLDAATQTFAFIARKGAGKTYACGKLVEQLLGAKVQCIVLDLVGNWWGLRLSSDGKGKGFDIPVLGGLRGDIPLNAESGGLIADIIVETGKSMVIDISQFSLGDRKKFATSLGERLWQQKKADAHPSPLHLVIEESQLIVPQNVDPGSARMVGIYEEIIRLGRNYGIGVSMISQRPQSVNKEVLNQTECLFVLQISGSQEREALKKWIVHQGMDPALLMELPSLPQGTAYVWSPQWLQVLKKVKIGRKETFDASATPKVGHENRVRRQIKPLDLDDLQEKMKSIIEQKKAEDPRELKKTIGELQRQLKNAEGRVQNAERQAGTKTEVKTVEKPVITDKQIERLEKLEARATERAKTLVEKVSAVVKPVIDLLEGERDEVLKLLVAARQVVEAGRQRDRGIGRPGDRPAAAGGAPASSDVVNRSAASRPRSKSKEVISSVVPDGAPDWMQPAHARIINAIAWLNSFGIDHPERGVVASMAGVSPNSSSFTNNISRLNTGDIIKYPRQGLLELLETGKALAAVPEEAPTLEDVHQAWRDCPAFQPAHVKLLDAVIEAYPGAVTRDELAQAAQVSVNSSSFTNNVSRLSSMGLVEYPDKGHVQATELLFPKGL